MSEAVRVRRRSGYSTIPNSVIRNTSLSAEARVMLCYIMSCSEEWVFYRSRSMEILGCGRDKYQKVIRELRGAGYLIIHPKRKSNGQLDGQEWEVIDEPQAVVSDGTSTTITQDVGERTENKPQNAVTEGGGRGPENQAPGETGVKGAHRGPEKTARRCEPPAGESGPLRKNNKQKEKQTSCAAPAAPNPDFDFGAFWKKFASVFPRVIRISSTQALLQDALGDGVSPAWILTAAQAYGEANPPGDRRYCAGSESWVRDRRWDETPKPETDDRDDAEFVQAWSKIIRETAENKTPFMRGKISEQTAMRCLRAGPEAGVTIEQCRKAGLWISDAAARKALVQS